MSDKPVKLDPARIVRCSHSRRERDDPLKCGWTGRADKYKKHLDENHGGKEYVPEPVGL